jgi:DNA-binding response OmpR family regulator
MDRILIVEDEEAIARFLELELRHEGYEVGKVACDNALQRPILRLDTP